MRLSDYCRSKIHRPILEPQDCLNCIQSMATGPMKSLPRAWRLEDQMGRASETSNTSRSKAPGVVVSDLNLRVSWLAVSGPER